MRLRINEVLNEAIKGRKEAFLCCEHHWWQLRRVRRKPARYEIGCGYCALCVRYNLDWKGTRACQSCKLYCIPFWHEVSLTLSNDTLNDFRREAAEMHRHIVRKIRKFYPGLVIPRHKE